MKNKEKYFDEILQAITENEDSVCKFVIRHIIDRKDCMGMLSCSDCMGHFKEWLEEEYVEPPKTVWELKPLDECYYINEVGYVLKEKWGTLVSNQRCRSQGNVFLTEDEARHEKRRREVYAIVKKYAYEFSDEEWRDCKILKMWPAFAHSNGVIAMTANYGYQTNTLYFKSEGDIDKAIKEVGEEDFIRYYLGVKDYNG